MKQLSIIIPIYNVEKYVFECVDSIFRQGLDEDVFEVIIVNDGTEDKSMVAIGELISTHHNITVLNQENQGLSVARNNGMAIATGEYIFMPDSDDLLFDNSLKTVLELALSTKADIVVTDFIQMNDNEIMAIRGKHPVQKDIVSTETTGPDLLTKELTMWYWRSLYKRSFLLDNNICFVPGIYSQDVPFTNECFLKAKKCIRTSWKTMIYRHGHDSVSIRFSLRKARDRCVAIAKIWELAKTDNLSPTLQQKQNDIVYWHFRLLIKSTTYGHLNSMKEMLEVVDYLKLIAPDLHFNNGMEQSLWSIMFNKMPHLLIYLNYIFEQARKKIRKIIH